MRTELVAVETDTTPLDGLYYEPDVSPVKGAVQLFHGNTMNFYVGALKFLPPVLTKLGFACLAYNRRGHDILSTRDSRESEGGAFQTFDEAFEDNRVARAWLMSKGFGAPIAIGHSNGGMLAVKHVAEHPDTPALVLLSAHRGGPELVRTASRHGLLAREQYDEFETLARAMVDEGRGRELIRLPGWWYVASAESYVGYLDRCPAILDLAPQIRCPVLFLVGDEEPADLYPAQAFARRAQGVTTIDVIPDCGHFYAGRESAVSRAVGDWLARLSA